MVALGTDSELLLGRIVINFRFADDIVVNAEGAVEADDVVTSLDTTCIRYKIIIWKVEIGQDEDNDKQP